MIFFNLFLQIIDIVSGGLSASFGCWPAAAAAADIVLFSLSMFLIFIIIIKAFKIMSVSLH